MRSTLPLRWLVGLLSAVGTGYWVFLSSYSQQLCPFPFRVPETGQPDRVVALTFDDGPNEPFTSEIADFLAEVRVRATFFQVGRCVERHPGVSARLVREGHVVGNHSYSHQMLACLRPSDQRTETQAAQDVLTSAIGLVPALYRPPWLFRTPSLIRVLRRHQLRPISGEFAHALEPWQPSPARIARRALVKARRGAILIFHDGFDSRGGSRANTVAAVRIVVTELLSEGYRFVTVDELLDLPAWQPDPAIAAPGTR